jgi:hypothetical protein
VGGAGRICPADYRYPVSALNRAPPHPALDGVARDGVVIDAVAVEYDLAAFLARFEKCWPEGSPARTSYHQRIVAGPSYRVEQAKGRARFA